MWRKTRKKTQRTCESGGLGDDVGGSCVHNDRLGGRGVDVRWWEVQQGVRQSVVAQLGGWWGMNVLGPVCEAEASRASVFANLGV